MKRHKIGQRVRAKSDHPKVTQGMVGHVASVHENQRFYGIGYGGGTAYLPAHLVDPTNEMDRPGEPDPDGEPTAPATAVAEPRTSITDRAKLMLELRRIRRGG